MLQAKRANYLCPEGSSRLFSFKLEHMAADCDLPEPKLTSSSTLPYLGSKATQLPKTGLAGKDLKSFLVIQSGQPSYILVLSQSPKGFALPNMVVFVSRLPALREHCDRTKAFLPL